MPHATPRTTPISSLVRHGRRLAHRRNRERARATVRAARLGSVLAVGAGLLVAVPFLSGAQAATPAGSPTGVAEHMISAPGGMQFTGWAVDPDTTTPITVYVTVDGKKSSATGASVVANGPRTDLSSTHPQGVGHGFDTTVLIPAGKHTVCVYAQNAPKTPGADTQLRCLTAAFDYDPVGAVTTFYGSNGTVHVGGWAYDSDAPTTPVTVAVFVDGKGYRVSANRSSSAAYAAHPRGGKNHGFAFDLTAAQGRHAVCVGFQNIAYGTSAGNVRCGTITVDDSPLGGIDTLAKQGTGIRLRGWAFDPDVPTTPLTISVTVDGVARSVPANLQREDVHKAHPYAGAMHGFDTVLSVKEGTHKVCVTVPNTGLGSNTSLGCKTIKVYYTPTAAITGLTQNRLGATVTGYATDPDTSGPVKVRVWVSGTSQAATLTANASSNGGHGFSRSFTLRSGARTVCVSAYNVGTGTHNSATVCRTVTLALSPLGAFEAATRVKNSTSMQITGWAFDPDTTAASRYTVTVDGKSVGTYTTNTVRSDVNAKYPMAGTTSPHGFSQTIAATDTEHRICITVADVGGGSTANLGCRIVIAVHPVAPSAVQSVKASGTYGAVNLSWAAPASDGGAPWSYYTVTSGSKTVKVASGVTSYTWNGLKQKTTYGFIVQAVNVAGASAGSVVRATTPAGPPPQTTPAPVSTSRYIRNIRGAGASDLATMRAEGVADARANPSGHRYMVLLDIGGQDQYDGGVILSATTRFISNANLVTALKSYVDGYASAQRSTAPATIALGTNNDVDVNATTGKMWADQVVDPVRSYSAKYGTGNIAIAGANDIEPGFAAGYSASSAWVKSFLANTTAGFVFNGSADGCAWTTTNRGCNNGWTMRGLYNVAQGFAPGRIVNLPQVYNTTMAAQWKYISLTGIQFDQPRIVFGGPLTEYTACAQANSCGSLTGVTAWQTMWNNLQSDARLRVSSLPYATDLRIDS